MDQVIDTKDAQHFLRHHQQDMSAVEFLAQGLRDAILAGTFGPFPRYVHHCDYTYVAATDTHYLLTYPNGPGQCCCVSMELRPAEAPPFGCEIAMSVHPSEPSCTEAFQRLAAERLANVEDLEPLPQGPGYRCRETFIYPSRDGSGILEIVLGYLITKLAKDS
ncbi:MAG: hypothetical protein EA401_01215 [Planctomycetota bacterium]|nr:MAG: hypothetical protein EA401_01215 [Planctomycetota bacterium]